MYVCLCILRNLWQKVFHGSKKLFCYVCAFMNCSISVYLCLFTNVLDWLVLLAFIYVCLHLRTHMAEGNMDITCVCIFICVSVCTYTDCCCLRVFVYRCEHCGQCMFVYEWEHARRNGFVWCIDGVGGSVIRWRIPAQEHPFSTSHQQDLQDTYHV